MQAEGARGRRWARLVGGRAEGRVQVTLPVSLGGDPFDALLEDFQERHPLLRVELDLATMACATWLAKGFDLAIRSGVEQDARTLEARPPVRPAGNHLRQSRLTGDTASRNARPSWPGASAC
ncbi:LysR substrate-binding domain-containing protein [Pseudomonas aeruginosa]